MDFQITIPDDAAEHLSNQAREELSSAAKTYALELVNEASRLEAGGRGDGGRPEITRSMVKDAALLLRKFHIHAKHSWAYTGLKILSVMSTFITGILFDLGSFRDPKTEWTLFLFVLSLTVAITSTTAHIIIGRSK